MPSLKEMLASGEATTAPAAQGQKSLRAMLDAGEASLEGRAKMGKLEAGARGFGQGVSLDFGDEIWGGLRAVGDSLPLALGGDPTINSLGEAYRKNRDMVRAKNKQAQEDQSGAYLVGNVAGGLATTPLIPGAAGANTLKALVKTGAALGAASGLGASDADLTKGEVGGAIADTALGGAVGAGAGGLARGAGRLVEKGGQVVGRLSQRLVRAERGAQAKLEGLAEEAVRKDIAQAAGALGGESQRGNRLVENLMRLESRGTPEQKAAVDALRKSGALDELEGRLLDSTLEELPKQKQVIDSARAGVEALTGNRQRAFQETLKRLDDPMAQIRPRLQRYAAPAVGALLGPGLGGVAGLVAGGDKGDAAIGALAGAGLRPGAQAIRRMLQHPALSRRLYGSLARLVPNGAREIPEEAVSSIARNAAPDLDALEYMTALAEAIRGEKRKQSVASY